MKLRCFITLESIVKSISSSSSSSIIQSITTVKTAKQLLKAEADIRQHNAKTQPVGAMLREMFAFV